MFPGSADDWGNRYGGPAYISECDKLPQYPTDSAAMREAGDDMVELCKYGFSKGVRLENNNTVQPTSNPTILDMGHVKCPDALVHTTQLQRSDDPDSYTFSASMAGFPNDSVLCQASAAYDLSYCLTRMMDCKKPSAGYVDNIQSNLVVSGRKVVQPCTSDGYTRLDVKCGCDDCYC